MGVDGWKHQVDVKNTDTFVDTCDLLLRQLNKHARPKYPTYSPMANHKPLQVSIANPRHSGENMQNSNNCSITALYIFFLIF